MWFSLPLRERVRVRGIENFWHPHLIPVEGEEVNGVRVDDASVSWRVSLRLITDQVFAKTEVRDF
jgi:hypothetical protein